jgi:hypothetical protein
MDGGQREAIEVRPVRREAIVFQVFTRRVQIASIYSLVSRSFGLWGVLSHLHG